MPRLHINLHDVDEIEDLEDQADWEKVLGLAGAETRRETRPVADPRGRGERRFGGSEAIDRKRAERRKKVTRAVRRV